MKAPNYNCDQVLWENYRRDAEADVVLVVRAGHVISEAGAAIGRFDDDKAARECLIAAGWTERKPFVFHSNP